MKIKNIKNNISAIQKNQEEKRGEDGSGHRAETAEKSLRLRPGKQVHCAEQATDSISANNGPCLRVLTTMATHPVKQRDKEHLRGWGGGVTAEEEAAVQGS